MQPSNKKFKEQDGLDQSQQQGFFTQKIEIKKSNQTHSRSISVHTRTHFNRQQFEAKYLPWTGPMKLQPVESFKILQSLISYQTGQKMQKKKNKTMNKQHPYKLYAVNENYELVYNRTNLQPIVNDKYFMSNEVKLQHVGGRNTEGFKRLREFDTKQVSDVKTGSLIFDSRFQCGNLHCAYKNTKYQEYVLFIDNDTNSLGYNQWFYFSIRNNQVGIEYSFKIVNFKKKHSFFKYGCKPAIFSLAQAKLKGEGWSKRAKNIVYEQSPIYIQQLPETKFYCLSFTLSFDHKDDYIMIAMSLPYSYTKMITFLRSVQVLAQDEEQKDLQFKIKSVCVSVCGNDIPEVTITRKSEQEKKKMIVIMARQHPGEIWSSYMVEGMIRKLVSKPDENIAWLLDNYVFKIYPMVNVDGVIYGNFRCDITGFDMNRRWKDTSRLMHPQIFQIKKKISLYRSEYKIDCCFDLHGHSKNYNIFCYSCKQNQLSCRILPLIISKINPDFHFPSCTFGISKYKQTTARAAINKIIKTQNVLTIQSSFYGSKIENNVKQFGPQDLFTMGSDILAACKHFLDKKSKMFQIVRKQIQNRINDFLTYDKQHEQDSGSESDPSGDEIDMETKIKNIFDNNVVTIEQLKGEKVEIKQKKSPIKLKVEQDNKLQIKGQQYKKKKSDYIRSSVGLKHYLTIKNNSQTIQQANLNRSNLGQPEVKKIERRSKKTISYSQQKNIEESEQLKVTNPSFRERKQKFTIHEPQISKSQRQSKEMHNRLQRKQQEIGQKKQATIKFRQSLADQQLQKSIQNVKKSDEFIKKFQRFIPISMAMKGRSNLSMFEQNLYNQDQSNLISLLLENKKKIELQKIKRNVQKSTYIVERQGKVKISSRQQKVVDFKSFKQNEKINQQIRKLASLRYSMHDQ